MSRLNGKVAQDDAKDAIQEFTKFIPNQRMSKPEEVT